MSLKAYCPSCGEPNYYTIQKPNFCGFCRCSFTNVIQQVQISQAKQHQVLQQKPVTTKPLRIKRDDNEIYEDDNFQLPSMEGLAFEIQETQPRKTTLGQVVASAPANKNDLLSVSRPKQKKMSKKDIEAILRQEGGSMVKGQTIQIGGD
jgi:hypothetical protein